MNKKILAELLLANARKDRESVSEDLQQILSAIRTHLDMDIAFIAEFSQGKRVFKYIDSKKESCVIKAGDSDPVNETYCHKIVNGEIPEHITDTLKNPITEKLDVTTALSIRHYMGVPIRIADGSIYGTFCCFNHKTDETIGERELSMLRIFADLAGKQIDSNIKSNLEKKEMTDRVISILDPSKLNMVYQPIYDIQQDKITGYESTLRVMTNPYRTPDVWINEAKQVGVSANLEIMAIKKATTELEQLPKDTYVSINTSPEHIINGAIATALKEISPKKVVLEITEHAPITDYVEFREALKPLRDRGILLAIDDAGAGYASFQHILEIAPDVIKLDTSIIHDVNVDPARHALATAIISFAKETNAEIIAEGVETQEEYNALRLLGVNKIQGFYIGRPMPILDAIALQRSEISRSRQDSVEVLANVR
ncbi:hypothetical protein GCM10009133_03120 [Cocleimonas flava]|uniref:EAL domain-containing protein (Putative c-di-GMP-specific phosphodiesterase class I) n=1 Tax=Cocleimonas flava TaxID=634765 RepID=A0A4R1EZ33_9GAMM|nr:EAL domain-containing protein [Cocleimonas flava]TCJ85284.1 EAL domain-containing protein (putative c-di-GMP-specific phosphodiesterase class I) [Cocleimonas flava]